MADHKPLTPDQQRRLEKAPYLSLVAYFHPRPPKAGKLFSQLVSLTADAVGDLRVSGHAIRNIPFDAERHGRLLRREYHRIYLHKLPKTLRRIARDSVVRGLNAGSFGSVWVNQMSPHRPTGLKELVWYLAYDENPRQFATDLDPYVHLFITIDRMSGVGWGFGSSLLHFSKSAPRPVFRTVVSPTRPGGANRWADAITTFVLVPCRSIGCWITLTGFDRGRDASTFGASTGAQCSLRELYAAWVA